MAEHHENTGPLEIGAAMDYAEHDKTFAVFVRLTKYGTIICVALMIAMAYGFFLGGIWTGAALWLVLSIAGIFLL